MPVPVSVPVRLPVPVPVPAGAGEKAREAPPSQSPLETFVVDIPELGGARIAITPCPGKRERDLGLDLDQLSSWGADAIVTLVEDDELAYLSVANMKAEVERRKMKWFHCPIRDFSGPGGPFELAWRAGAGKQVRNILRASDELQSEQANDYLGSGQGRGSLQRRHWACRDDCIAIADRAWRRRAERGAAQNTQGPTRGRGDRGSGAARDGVHGRQGGMSWSELGTAVKHI
mmetsp:Transcript_16579/g.58078  ORF Transcript_16579/g.58078 Transcript_16579/m.58078 type:complete len:231 (+) Transcript_16579:190-882(+)